LSARCLQQLETRSAAQVAGALNSTLKPRAQARPALAGPGQTLNLASTFAAAVAKANAVQADLAPQVSKTRAGSCLSVPVSSMVTACAAQRSTFRIMQNAQWHACECHSV